VVASLAAAVVLLAVFVVIEARSTDPLLPVWVLRNRDRSGAYALCRLPRRLVNGLTTPPPCRPGVDHRFSSSWWQAWIILASPSCHFAWVWPTRSCILVRSHVTLLRVRAVGASAPPSRPRYVSHRSSPLRLPAGS
jgi:hypothetical protein